MKTAILAVLLITTNALLFAEGPGRSEREEAVDRAKAQIRNEADRSKIRRNLMYASGMALPYFQEEPQAKKITVRELSAWWATKVGHGLKLEPVLGESYDDVLITKDSKAISIKLPNGEKIEIENK